MYKVRLLFLHYFPTIVDDVTETECFMVLLPTMTDKYRVSVRKGRELELCMGAGRRNGR